MYNISGSNNFIFGNGKQNNKNDFLIFTSGKKLSYFDYLIFTDSKGYSEPFNISWVHRLIKKLEYNEQSYLAIVRPFEMTVFFSLINFLKLNKIKFKNLITNLGFVDLTPKKKEFVEDILIQIPIENNNRLGIVDICDYELSSGKIAKLSTVNYNDIIKDISREISENFQNAFLLGTFEFTPEINIPRKRPIEFYSQLRETNKFINKICEFSSNLKYISVLGDWLKNGEEISYDAVHFTESGHKLVFSLVEKELGL